MFEFEMDMPNDLETFASSASSWGHGGGPFDHLVNQYMGLFELSETDAIEKVRSIYGLLPPNTRGGPPSKAAAYLVKLEPPLNTPEIVRDAGGLEEVPTTVCGTSDSGVLVQFCRVDERTRHAIARHFAHNKWGNAPTFLQLTRASKSLSANSAAPFLGFDATLPQNRLNSCEVHYRPMQDEYPVWYFVYGPLADPDELRVILNLECMPSYRPASVLGARLLSENAITDACSFKDEFRVQGKAFHAINEAQEESLRFSVTEKFEVMRCRMVFEDSGDEINALVFGYAGNDL